MEYIPNARDAAAFAEERTTEQAFLKVLRDVVSGLQYLHSQSPPLVHMDIKPGNIVVMPDGTGLIVDFGFAKWLKAEGENTLIGGTEGYLHPDARKFVESSGNPDRLRGPAPRDALKTVWDLYALGKTLLKLIAITDETEPPLMSEYTHRYLRLMAFRMLDGQNSEDDHALALRGRAFAEIKYRTIDEVALDLDKLLGSYSLSTRIAELNLHLPDTIQVTTLATTPFPSRVRDLIETPAMQRLGTYTQLGLLNLVYPPANHNRLEHSLGTFSIMCRILMALYHDPLDPLFRQIMSEEDLKVALLTALLHDVGQFPLAHDIEEADPAIKHEKITTEIIEQDEKLNAVLDQWEVKPERILAVLNADPRSRSGTLKDRILHSLINGPIDADKLDYLARDCAHLGLTYADGIDLPRLLSTMAVLTRDVGGKTDAALGVHEKGKIPAESVAFARYAMFGQVYWHHAYRAIKSMVHWLLWEAYRVAKDRAVGRRAIAEAELTPNDDEESVGRTAVTALRRALMEFVKPGGAVMQAEPTLFQTSEQRTIGQIHHTDFAVLKWLADRGGQSGQDLFGLLLARRPFKRTLVLSRDNPEDQKLWDDLHETYYQIRADWQRKLSMQQALQRLVIEAVERARIHLPKRPGLQRALEEKRTEFLGVARQSCVLTIDVPPERRAAASPLLYIAEADRELYKADNVEIGAFYESGVWKKLQAEFHFSLGRVRVFGHPKYSKFLRLILGRQELKRILTRAAQEVGR